MARKRKHDEESISETWLLPYADLLTLLLALFIVLFASSSIDAQKFEQLAQSLNNALQGGVGVMDHPATLPITPLPPIPVDDQEGGEEEEATESGDFLELQDLQARIDTYITDNELGLSLQTDLTQDGLMITILDGALFDPGKADIKEEASQLASEISSLLVTDPPRHVTITGHTDTVPIGNSQFRSNWDLSSMRALNFMEILLENENLEPHRFSFTGHGEYRPVSTNETVEGRAKNRRVEVLILPNYDLR